MKAFLEIVELKDDVITTSECCDYGCPTDSDEMAGIWWLLGLHHESPRMGAFILAKTFEIHLLKQMIPFIYKYAIYLI